ncbi:MAG: hypothetical protein L6Q59_16340 [Ignavibacteriaceae bacterium]|nr:hypothetical protein [Ignavibacteriaceae bacterium]
MAGSLRVSLCRSTRKHLNKSNKFNIKKQMQYPNEAEFPELLNLLSNCEPRQVLQPKFTDSPEKSGRRYSHAGVILYIRFVLIVRVFSARQSPARRGGLAVRQVITAPPGFFGMTRANLSDAASVRDAMLASPEKTTESHVSTIC